MADPDGDSSMGSVNWGQAAAQVLECFRQTDMYQEAKRRTDLQKKVTLALLYFHTDLAETAAMSQQQRHAAFADACKSGNTAEAVRFALIVILESQGPTHQAQRFAMACAKLMLKHRHSGYKQLETAGLQEATEGFGSKEVKSMLWLAIKLMFAALFAMGMKVSFQVQTNVSNSSTKAVALPLGERKRAIAEKSMYDASDGGMPFSEVIRGAAVVSQNVLGQNNPFGLSPVILDLVNADNFKIKGAPPARKDIIEDLRSADSFWNQGTNWTKQTAESWMTGSNKASEVEEAEKQEELRLRKLKRRWDQSTSDKMITSHAWDILQLAVAVQLAAYYLCKYGLTPDMKRIRSDHIRDIFYLSGFVLQWIGGAAVLASSAYAYSQQADNYLVDFMVDTVDSVLRTANVEDEINSLTEMSADTLAAFDAAEYDLALHRDMLKTGITKWVLVFSPLDNVAVFNSIMNNVHEDVLAAAVMSFSYTRSVEPLSDSVLNTAGEAAANAIKDFLPFDISNFPWQSAEESIVQVRPPNQPAPSQFSLDETLRTQKDEEKYKLAFKEKKKQIMDYKRLAVYRRSELESLINRNNRGHAVFKGIEDLSSVNAGADPTINFARNTVSRLQREFSWQVVSDDGNGNVRVLGQQTQAFIDFAKMLNFSAANGTANPMILSGRPAVTAISVIRGIAKNLTDSAEKLRTSIVTTFNESVVQPLKEIALSFVTNALLLQQNVKGVLSGAMSAIKGLYTSLCDMIRNLVKSISDASNEAAKKAKEIKDDAARQIEKIAQDIGDATKRIEDSLPSWPTFDILPDLNFFGSNGSSAISQSKNSTVTNQTQNLQDSEGGSETQEQQAGTAEDHTNSSKRISVDDSGVMAYQSGDRGALANSSPTAVAASSSENELEARRNRLQIAEAQERQKEIVNKNNEKLAFSTLDAVVIMEKFGAIEQRLQDPASDVVTHLREWKKVQDTIDPVGIATSLASAQTEHLLTEEDINEIENMAKETRLVKEDAGSLLERFKDVLAEQQRATKFLQRVDVLVKQIGLTMMGLTFFFVRSKLTEDKRKQREDAQSFVSRTWRMLTSGPYTDSVGGNKTKSDNISSNAGTLRETDEEREALKVARIEARKARHLRRKEERAQNQN